MILLIIEGLIRKGIAKVNKSTYGSNYLASPSNTIIFYNRVAVCPSNFICNFYVLCIIY